MRLFCDVCGGERFEVEILGPREYRMTCARCALSWRLHANETIAIEVESRPVPEVAREAA